MNQLVQRLRGLRKKDDGATAVEYGLLVALIAVVIAGAAWGLGVALDTKFDKAKDCVTATAACP